MTYVLWTSLEERKGKGRKQERGMEGQREGRKERETERGNGSIKGTCLRQLRTKADTPRDALAPYLRGLKYNEWESVDNV